MEPGDRRPGNHTSQRTPSFMLVAPVATPNIFFARATGVCLGETSYKHPPPPPPPPRRRRPRPRPRPRPTPFSCGAAASQRNTRPTSLVSEVHGLGSNRSALPREHTAPRRCSDIYLVHVVFCTPRKQKKPVFDCRVRCSHRGYCASLSLATLKTQRRTHAANSERHRG